MSTSVQTYARNDVDRDVVVVGAGFGGLRFLIEARELGLTARLFEAGTDVGGTWYWNRYPGARTDTESWGYCYPFHEMTQEWDWTERFPQQREVQAYMGRVAERYDLRRDIQFSTRVASAHYDEARNVWTVTTEAGQTVTCTYFVTATGCLSVPLTPPFPGLDTFEGEWYQTSRWPKEKVETAGKRIAVVGAGATAVQVLPAVAHTAAHVTLFQRTPNFVMPARNRVIDEEERASLKASYDTIWEHVYNQTFGFPFADTWRPSADVTSDEEFQRILEAGWEAGAFRYLFESFQDVLANAEVNEKCAEFVRGKIRAIVKDPKTAELLCPTDHPLGAKRPPVGHFYYETFNRENVSLVSVVGNPITEITPKGIRLQDGTEHEVDLIIFAIGFDGGTGAMTAMDIRGRDGRNIVDEWADGARTAYGVACAGFPNMFMMSGPLSPSGNFPPMHHRQSGFVSELIRHAREQNCDRIEPHRSTQEAWGALCKEIFDTTLLGPGGVAGKAWWIGANIEGKAIMPVFHFGGVPNYLAAIEFEVQEGFPGFALAAPVSSAA